MKNSKASLAIAMLMLFILACTCGKKYEYNSNNRNISINENNSNNSNSSNDNGTENNNRSNDNGSTPTVSSSSTGIAECDAYMKLIEDYLNCESIPEASREQWRKQRDDTIRQIRDSAKTDAQKAVMAGVCKQMVDTVKDKLVCK